MFDMLECLARILKSIMCYYSKLEVDREEEDEINGEEDE